MEFNPKIEVKSDPETVVVQIGSADELKAFLENELAQWSWLDRPELRKIQTFREVGVRQLSWFSSVQSQLNSLNEIARRRRGGSAAEDHRILSNLRSMFDLVTQGNVVLSDTVRGQEILQLAKRNPPAALVRLARVVRKGDFDTSISVNVDTVDAIFEEMFSARDVSEFDSFRKTVFRRLDRQISDLVASAKKRLDEAQQILAEVAGQRESESSRLKELSSELEADLQALVAQTNGAIANSLESLSTEVNRSKASLSASVEETKKSVQVEFERFRQALKSDLRLQAPVSYWRVQYKINYITMWVALAGLSILGLALIASVLIWGPSVIEALPRKDDGGLWLGEVVLLTIPTVAYFWLMRYVGRVFVASQQGAADAAARATMTETFLALAAEENSGIGAQERILILQALFRPGPRSEVDEAAEANVLDLLKQMTPGGAARG